MSITLVVLAAVGGAALLLALSGLRIVKEYQRGVVFRIGRFSHMKAPGPRLLIPIADHMIRVDVRAMNIEIPAQDVITEDNVMVTVRAVVYLQVVNPPLAVTKVVDYRDASQHLVESSLRSTLGQVTLAELLTGRDKVNALLARVINQDLEAWGVQITAIEIKDVLLPETMLRALGRQVEAEHETKAKLITAQGELAAVRALSDAAGAIAGSPSILQLRYLETLTQIGNQKSTVVVFPVPIDLIQPLLDMQARVRGARSGNGGAPAEPEAEAVPEPEPVRPAHPEPVPAVSPARTHRREPVGAVAGAIADPPPPPPPPPY